MAWRLLLPLVEEPIANAGSNVKIQSIARSLASTGVALAVLLGASSSQATTVLGTGYANGSESFNVITPPFNGANAGGFTGLIDGLPDLFWCDELTQFFSFGTTYTDYTASIVSNPTLGELFTEVGGSVGATSSTLFSAAFQLAVWEIRYENPANPYDLSSGDFKVTSGDPAAVAQATFWLNHLPTTSDYTVTLLHSDNEQDFVLAHRLVRQSVPEPSALALVGMGLAGLFFALPRSRNAIRRRAAA